MAHRVLILDLDAHCGGGTHDIVRDDPRIWQVDVSVSRFDTYATTTERHRLEIVRSASAYLDTIERELSRASGVGFDLILYNAGMDPHEDCGIGGLRGIDTATIRQREALVFDWARRIGAPIAFVLAGGYSGHAMPEDRLAALHGLTVAAAATLARDAGRPASAGSRAARGRLSS